MRRVLVQTLVVVLFIGGGMALTLWLLSTKPQAKRRKPPRPIPMVRTVEVKVAPHRVSVKGEGTVRPVATLELVPEVAGRVVYVSPSLVEGGEFEKGEVLVKIDPEDYRLALSMAKVEVAEAESQLRLLQEEAKAALEEWRASGGVGNPPPLLVKGPQIEAARARLEGARARLRKAELDLQRTALRAPFAGRVASEGVEVGQYVTPGKPLALLYSREAVEVRVFLPLGDASWIRVPGWNLEAGEGSPAVVILKAGGREFRWRGEVTGIGGGIDERTRLLPVVVRVRRPFETLPPLLPGAFVEVEIMGAQLQGVALIPRRAVRGQRSVWVLDEGGKLRLRKVGVLRYQGDQAIVYRGLEDGDRVVLTPLREATEGMEVRELR